MGDLEKLVKRQGAREFEVSRVTNNIETLKDLVATEEPLEIRLGYSEPNGKRAERSISITMRTPGNDEELAVGFLLTEGIIKRRRDISVVRPCGPPASNGLINVVRAELAAGVDVELDRLQRNFYTSSSCGVCGKASLDAVAVQGRFDLHTSEFAIERATLGGLPAMLITEQSLFEQTGGLHASGLFKSNGEIISVREDVGRHNALDKLIGDQFLKDQIPLSGNGIIVSGRASFELLQKAMVAGCPMVAAVGAPSSLAVELADEFGMTLVGFLGPDHFNIYTRPDRIIY